MSFWTFFTWVESSKCSVQTGEGRACDRKYKRQKDYCEEMRESGGVCEIEVLVRNK